MRYFTQRLIKLILSVGVLALTLGLVLPQGLEAAVYKWRDDKGKLHFTDHPSKIPLKYRKKHSKPVYGSPPPQTGLSSFGSTAGGSEEAGDFSAFDSFGRRVPITVTDDTVMFAMATWCPYSKKLVKFLNDPDVARKMQHLNLIFIFHDEWPYIRKWLDKSVRKGQLTQQQAERQFERFQEKADGKIVFDPNFLTDLPGKHYFATHAATKLKNIFPGSIPRVYSPSQENFGHGISKWLYLQFKGEVSTRDYLMAEFKKYNKGKK